MRACIAVVLLWVFTGGGLAGQQPVRIGIAGLSHSHVLPLLRNPERSDIRIVGIFEEDQALADRYAAEFSIDKNLVFGNLEEMLDEVRPDGVITFTSIYDHLKVVEACAPRGIHVMVEKPLAVNGRHADKMAFLARKHGIMLLTNYETTWYPSVYESYERVGAGQLGELRKVLVYDGHKGPEEIRVNREFLDWLTDPAMNGGGAVTDFGCYGANLMTWLMQGEKPVSVYARLKSYKPLVYPEVDDDATILLSYPGVEAVVNASWNWPFNRKDMHLYGSKGYILCDDARTIRFKTEERTPEKQFIVPDDKAPYPDGFAFFASVIRGETVAMPTDLSSLENNLIVVAILDAAKMSNRTGKAVKLK